ncbi:hypothetical protein R3W88_031909 [Solanum pinnatisectum]|uniref:Uncharacterized protein n=1 Tax=Solanum pinnatisectum TaxID=50273 RepID=A0AAV9LP13_9SOLN|nr:hypothetical protein R3W88_031909 [Solanum pinnatisectum]
MEDFRTQITLFIYFGVFDTLRFIIWRLNYPANTKYQKPKRARRALQKRRERGELKENVRNSILDRKATSFFKKVEELSILRDVEVAIYERIKKFVKHETYLLRKVDKKEKQISKLDKMNEQKEMKLLFNQLVEGKSINELDAREMKGLFKVCATKMTKINERKEQPRQPPNPSSNNENVTLSRSPMGDSFND